MKKNLWISLGLAIAIMPALLQVARHKHSVPIPATRNVPDSDLKDAMSGDNINKDNADIEQALDQAHDIVHKNSLQLTPRPTEAQRAATEFPPEKDLSGQWWDVSRSQYIGSCHAYCASALMEAAYFRSQRSEYVHICEDDVWLNATLFNSGEDGALDVFKMSGEPAINEGNWPDVDIQYVFDHGATQVLDENDEFHKSFAKNLKLWEKSVIPLMDVCNKCIQQAAGMKQLGSGQPTTATEACDIRCKSAQALLKGPQIDRMKKAISDEGKIMDTDAARDQMRQGLKDQLKGSRLYKRRVDLGSDAHRLTSESYGKCKDSDTGKELLQTLVTELAAGHPIGVAMNLAGLPAWGLKNFKGSAAHAFVIKGYKKDFWGAYYFQTRNSWGPALVQEHQNQDNPDLDSDDLCRIEKMYIVLAPGEAAPASHGFPSSPAFELTKTAD